MFGFEDHGISFMFADFDYEDYWSNQGFGYCINEEFIKKFIQAFGVEQLHECAGKLIKVEHCSYKITKLTPLSFNAGTEFDIAAWSKKYSKKEKK